MSCNHNCNQGRNCTCERADGLFISRWFWAGGALCVLLWTAIVLAMVR